MEFKVGDIVEAFGLRGVVVKVNAPHDTVHVHFGDLAGERSFDKEGKYAYWHKTPSLKLIERPKKMVKKQVSLWVNIYPSGHIEIWYPEEEATQGRTVKRIARVELKGEYEVEE